MLTYMTINSGYNPIILCSAAGTHNQTNSQAVEESHLFPLPLLPSRCSLLLRLFLDFTLSCRASTLVDFHLDFFSFSWSPSHLLPLSLSSFSPCWTPTYVSPKKSPFFPKIPVSPGKKQKKRKERSSATIQYMNGQYQVSLRDTLTCTLQVPGIDPWPLFHSNNHMSRNRNRSWFCCIDLHIIVRDELKKKKIASVFWVKVNVSLMKLRQDGAKNLHRMTHIHSSLVRMPPTGKCSCSPPITAKQIAVSLLHVFVSFHFTSHISGLYLASPPPFLSFFPIIVAAAHVG